jgi:hypothetical protein
MGRITELVERAIRMESAPPGAWWVPAEHGGGAPRLAEVNAATDPDLVREIQRELQTLGERRRALTAIDE